MIDQNSQFMAILTAVGEAKQANADALGVPWTFAQMGVGDAGGADPLPDRAQTKLINERRRAPLNQVKIDPQNSNVIIAEQVIPENVGGWWIREIGLYDADGDLVAVANCAPSFKPLLAQGSGKTQVVRMNFIVTSAANVVLKIDPSVVLATRQYVDDSITAVLPPTRQPGNYRQVTINARGLVESGSNPSTLEGYEIAPASQEEAEVGEDNTKPMTALRVAQVFAGRVIQATERVLGLARIGTQEQVNTGTDDSTIVTPKKLRLGFQIVAGTVGYIVFPSWLGSWIVQWHAGMTLQGSTTNITHFPIPFPNKLGSVVVGGYNNGAIGNNYLVYLSDGVGGAAGAVSEAWFKTMNNGVTGSAGLSYIAVGN